MGSWGIGLLQDDTVLDIIDEFNYYLKQYQSVSESTIKIIDNNQDILSDEDVGPLFWIALGKCQWDYGQLDSDVMKKIKDDFKEERGLSVWRDESESEYLKRKKVLSDFIQKISIPNQKTKKFPKLVIRKPLFIDGDCLALNFGQEYFGAALVIKTDHSNLEYGRNLIIVLDYWDKRLPIITDFIEPKFLELTYGNWNGALHISWYSRLGFSEFKNRLTKIGNIDVSQYKDYKSGSFSNWDFLFRLFEKQKNFIVG